MFQLELFISILLKPYNIDLSIITDIIPISLQGGKHAH